MKKFIEITGWLSGLVTVLSAGVALVWFFFGLNSRIETLESQVQAIYQSASSGHGNIKTEESKNSTSLQKSADTKKMQNLADTCSTLALKVADAYEKSSPYTVAEPLQKMMDKLGCGNIQ